MVDYDLEIQKLRFWKKVNKTDACWLWTANVLKGGYGLFKADRQRLAHRVAFFYEHGAYPVGVLRHTCDTPACVNPEHLIDGTQAENIADTIARGRYVKAVGEKNGHAKLSNQRVKELREEYALGGISTSEIARRENISQGCIWRMLKGKSYNI